MSQLSISIGNRLGMPIDVSVGAGGELSFIYGWVAYGSQDLDVHNEWDAVQGSGAIRHTGAGEMYTQGNGYTRFVTDEQPADDQFAECLLTNSWSTFSDFMGLMVRGSAINKSGYSFDFGDEGLRLARWDDGVKTILDEDLITTPDTADLFELRAVGTTISVLKNSVEIFSEVDATFSSGWIGLISNGLDAQAEINNFIGGAHPRGNAMKFMGSMARPTFLGGALPIVDGCMTLGGVTDINDTSLTNTAIHDATVHDIGGATDGHFFEYDLLLPCYTEGLINYDRLSHHANAHWDDVSVFGRAVPEDEWTEIIANGDMSDAPNFGWLTPLSWAGVTYRYYRVEVYSTLEASNKCMTYECAFLGGSSV